MKIKKRKIKKVKIIQLPPRMLYQAEMDRKLYEKVKKRSEKLGFTMRQVAEWGFKAFLINYSGKRK